MCKKPDILTDISLQSIYCLNNNSINNKTIKPKISINICFLMFKTRVYHGIGDRGADKILKHTQTLHSIQSYKYKSDYQQ